MMRILAIDTGPHTGFSLNIDPPLIHSWQRNLGETSKPHRQLRRILQTIDPDFIVYETFDFRQAKHGVDLMAAEFIGVIKDYGQTCNVHLVPQNPSVKSQKGFWTDDKLRHLGLYMPSAGHAMDALRHRLHYELDQGMFDLMRLKDV